MKEPIEEHILKQLMRGAAEDELIYSLCEETGMKWDEAQARVARVRSEHQVDIEARQAPMKSILSFALFLGGGLMTIGSVVYLWYLLDLTSTLLAVINNPPGADSDTVFRLLGDRYTLLSWFEIPSILFTMVLGIGIMAANMRYMRGVWDVLFRKWKVYE